MSIPPTAKADVRDPNQRWEMWHNHPDLDGGRNKGSQWPSAGDLGAAVEHRGLASVGVINETGEWTYIDIRRRKGLNGPGLNAWIDDVEQAAERTLSNAKAKNEPVKLTRSEATMRALERRATSESFMERGTEPTPSWSTASCKMISCERGQVPSNARRR